MGHEFADFSGLSKSDVYQMKAYLTRQTDAARPAYGRITVKQPRRCVLWGTTNETEYLQAQDGNRRFWCVTVENPIDLGKLRKDRDQLWAEAAYLELQLSRDAVVNIDRSLWDDAGKMQEQRRVRDPWEDVLANIPNEYVSRREGQIRVSAATILERLLGVERKFQTTNHAKRLAVCMKRAGWKRPKNGLVRLGSDDKDSNARVRGYFREDLTSDWLLDLRGTADGTLGNGS